MGVKTIEDFCGNLELFDNTNKSLEDRVAVCMELQEDIAAKVLLIEESIAKEQELLPQGEGVPADALAHKDELERIHKFTLDLQEKVKKNTSDFSEDVKFWAEYRTGIKEFTPWLTAAENEAKNGLGKPASLPEALALFDKISLFDKGCLRHEAVLKAAKEASLKMTTHQEADEQTTELFDRYTKVKAVSDAWMSKVETLVKEWQLLDNTVNELNTWVAKDKTDEGENQFSLEKMESTLCELKNIFKEKEKLVDELDK